MKRTIEPYERMLGLSPAARRLTGRPPSASDAGMRRLLVVAAVLLPLVAHAEAPPDRAKAVGSALWNALGGDAGWSHARYLRFDWIVEREGKRVVARSHSW